MAKFLYFQDGHCKGRNSLNRTGDYFTDWLIKFDELLALAKEHKVEAILDGGDLLDSPEPSYRILDEIADRVEKAKIPIYCLFGNHAQRYHSNEHSKYTGLAHLIKRSDYFNYMDFFNDIAEESEHDGYIIKPIEYNHYIEEEIKKDGIIFPKTNAWKVAIVHAFVCPKKFPYASHVVCDDIKTNADVVLVAHYHSEWEKIVGDTLYKDIGCFGRNSITEAKITPSCLLIDTEKRELKEIKLESAKKAEDIFDFTKVEAKKDFNRDIEDFVKSLESVEYQKNSIRGLVKELANQNGVDNEIVQRIYSKMDELSREN